MSSNFVEEFINPSCNNFSQNNQFYEGDQFPIHESIINTTTTTPLLNYQNSSNDHSSKVTMSNDINETNSVTKKQSPQSSTVLSGEQVSVITPVEKKRRNRNGSRPNSAQSKDGGEVKSKRAKKSDQIEKISKGKNEKKIISEEEPKGYIHVRARRGQATDSHSLAERVRREKISERMKILQRLVPGCDKVTGKALMLDEIINYVQSLQNQVEFLSMKLATVNPMFYDFGVDLEPFMVRPQAERVNSMSQIQQCSPTTVQPPPVTTTFIDNATTTTTTAATTNFVVTTNNYPLAFPQDNGSIMWDVDEERRKFVNQSVAFSNNLCSFH
ncbi:hypothetical protein ACFE04_028248 [Oxalis oulophora]